MTDNPSSPIPARALLWLFFLFFIVPGLCCVGCMATSYLLPTPAERGAQPESLDP